MKPEPIQLRRNHTRSLAPDQLLSDLLVEAARVKADIFIAATTRPQGYAGQFPEEQYEHVRLESWVSAQAAI
jgi:hypothetical protein